VRADERMKLLLFKVMVSHRLINPILHPNQIISKENL